MSRTLLEGSNVDAQLVKSLSEIVGRENISTDPEELFCHTYDASFNASRKVELPGVVAMPGNTSEVSRVLALANSNRCPVIPRGSGSNVSGGTLPVQGCIILGLNRMNRIIEIDRKNLVAVVEAGVITGQFQAEVEKVGLFYPPDPASLAFSTMGGNVAECAGGPRGVKYGVTRDYVLGLEVVLANGDIIRTGARTMKSVAGYDLTRLFTGSEGTLGVITQVIIKLIPLPPAKKTLLAAFADLNAAAETVSEIISNGIIPTTLEFLDQIYIRNIEEYTHAGLPVQAEAILLIEVDGDPLILDRQAAQIEKICLSKGAVEVKVAATKEEAEKVWVARRSAFAAVSRVRPTIIGEDITVPRDLIPEMVRRTRRVAEKYDIIIAILGHAGDGNLHATILTDERDREEMERVEKAIPEIFRDALELGGTLTGEHGIGAMKAKYLKLETGPLGLAVMRKIKEALDPNGILNPGKVFGE